MQTFPDFVKSDSHLSEKFALFASLKTLKNYKECFLFHLKRSFRSQDIWFFYHEFLVM